MSDTIKPIFTLNPALPQDDKAVEKLIALTFGKDRHARLVNRLRANSLPYRDACYVAKDESENIIGSIRYFIAETESAHRFPFLGPLAVKPRLRGLGIGKNLIAESLQKLKSLNHTGVLIVGDSGYYAPFGFTPLLVENLSLGDSVSPLTFMGLEWQPQSLSSAHGQVKFVNESD